MTEVELKARVQDKDALKKRLDKIAAYRGFCTRDDTYYSRAEDIHRKIRIRKECKKDNDGEKTAYILTYKRKELKTLQDGSTSEVNDEKETVIQDPVSLELFLQDTGFSVSLKKHKEVMDWTLPLENLSATFELCTVPPLGDFLEIEILVPTNSEEKIEQAQKKLQELLLLAGLNKSDIENRYYSELLAMQR